MQYLWAVPETAFPGREGTTDTLCLIGYFPINVIFLNFLFPSCSKKKGILKYDHLIQYTL
jgi:hypothetical protein